jgi:hypothetical protein
VQDFAISASPTTVNVNVGVAGTSTVTVTGIQGFNGAVALAADNAACTVAPNSVTGAGTATLSCTFASAQITTVTVTGTATSVSHSTTVTFIGVAQTGCGAGCSIASDATIANVFSNSTIISFTATGSSGTTAFANVTIPVASVPSINSLKITINGTSTPFTLTTDGTSFFVYFTFTFHSTLVIQISLAAPTVQAVLLTFTAFDMDDFENSTGQLQVFVNGHLVVDIPAGLNHLTGTGDYQPYDHKWINFGPFDITSFVIQGQNTIVFKDPLSSHFGLVRNVTILQGSTVLLKVPFARSVFSGHPVTYTFSIPPLVLTSFTVSTKAPTVEQAVTFTATYTGGTAPFKCIFAFGDGDFAVVNGTAGSCSVTHDYDDSGNFTAFVTVRGSSTSDKVSSSISIQVTEDPAPAVVPMIGSACADEDDD